MSSDEEPTENLKFVDDIAEDEDDPDNEDDEEEDDDDEEDGVDEDVEEDPAKRRRLYQEQSGFHEAFDQQRHEVEEEEMRKKIEAKYAGYEEDPDAYARAEAVEGGGSSMKDRLPSIQDPKLWLVRCDPGKEDVAVLALIQKSYKKMGTSEQVFIKSAFSTPASKGYVYIEADKEIHVKRAITGIRLLKWWKIQLVPITEMVDAISIKQQKAAVKKKQWVRMKGGVFKGDLAQVVAFEDQGARVTVKLVPRIDYAALQHELKTALAKENGEFTGKAPKRKLSKGVRPLPRLFDKQQIQELGGFISSKGGTGNDPHSKYDFFKNQKYKFGFMFRTVPSRSLVVECSPPTLDELDLFKSRLSYDSDSDDDEDPTANAPVKKQVVCFLKDDRIVVTKGDLRNLTGRVLHSFGGMVAMMADSAELTEAMDFPITDVRKYFRVGDHVKVIAGKDKDETGLIVQICEKDETVVVFSDISSREMKLFANDIIESSEVSTGRDTLGNFELYDLVTLNSNVVGVIVKIEVGTFKLMTTTGTVESAKLQDIDRKRTSKFATALDSTQENTVSVDDVVKVLNGGNQGKQGPIKHIYRHSIFIYSRQELDNGGIFVAQARHCLLMGQTANHMGLAARSPKVHGGGDRDENGANKRDTRIQNFRRDPWIGLKVFITRGPFKGYHGSVLAATEDKLRVALLALNKNVSILRKWIKIKDEKVSAGANYGFTAQTPLLGSQTPAYGGATPARADGGMTPMHSGFGSRTPMHDGSATPSRDVWNPSTPHHNPTTPRTTNDEDLDFDEAEMYDQPWSSGTHQPVTPHTPHTPLQTPHTPHTPHNPKTPYTADDLGVQTPADGDVPLTPVQTPYTPNTPVDDWQPPRTPNTPAEDALATPNTPSTPNDFDEENEESFGNAGATFLLPGVFVRVVEEDMDDDDDEGVEAIISHTSGLDVVLKTIDGNSMTVPATKLVPVVPQTKDTVKIIDNSENQGKVGTLIGTDVEDGIVKIGDGGSSDILIKPLGMLVKFHVNED